MIPLLDVFAHDQAYNFPFTCWFKFSLFLGEKESFRNFRWLGKQDMPELLQQPNSEVSTKRMTATSTGHHHKRILCQVINSMGFNQALRMLFGSEAKTKMETGALTLLPIVFSRLVHTHVFCPFLWVFVCLKAVTQSSNTRTCAEISSFHSPLDPSSTLCPSAW